MSHHRFTTASDTRSSARWHCQVCRLSTAIVYGPSAAAETTLLAGVHDRLHHGGARTAQLLLTVDSPALLAAAS